MPRGISNYESEEARFCVDFFGGGEWGVSFVDVWWLAKT
jgi:hypothetical protein